MTQSRRQPPTPDAITAALGRRLTELRQAAGIRSQAELGKRMTDHGVPWSRVSVEKLENGRRGSITVQELLALALVLEVPPVMLLADPHHVAEVPLSDQQTVSAWDALGWLTGAKWLDPARREPAGFTNSWMLVALLRMAEALDLLARAPRMTGTRTEDGRLTMDPDEVREITEKRERGALETIRAVLQTIADQPEKLAVPEVPEFALRRAAELGVDLPSQEA